MSKPNLRSKDIAKSPRAFAINLIMQCNNGAFANDIVPDALNKSDFDKQDRALITKIVYTTLRNQIRIDHAIARLSSKPLEKLDGIAICALRSVTAQLLEGMSGYAVINETVKVMPLSIKGFVNGVSRKIAELHTKNELFIDESLATKHSLPDWIYEEIEQVFPQNIKEVAQALNTPAQVTLALYKGQSFHEHSSHYPEEHGKIIESALLVSSQGSIADLDVIKRGEALVVDQGSQLVAQCLDAQENDVILDLCSAPGGKTFLLSQKAAMVVSADSSFSRMKKLIQTKERVNAKNVYPIVADARSVPLDKQFNKILIDAPCSGLGVLRRRPDARMRIEKESVLALAGLQKEILRSAISLMEYGQTLLYSVCTFTREETVEIDKWLEREYPELVAQDLSHINSYLKSAGRGYLLAPGDQNDGMYVLKMCRSE